jgi:hypothetical protein
MPSAPIVELLSSEERVLCMKDIVALKKLLADNSDVSSKKEDLSYTTTQLLQGLSSPHDAAREGFTLTLCILLQDKVITYVPINRDFHWSTRWS